MKPRESQLKTAVKSQNLNRKPCVKQQSENHRKTTMEQGITSLTRSRNAFQVEPLSDECSLVAHLKLLLFMFLCCSLGVCLRTRFVRCYIEGEKCVNWGFWVTFTIQMPHVYSRDVNDWREFPLKSRRENDLKEIIESVCRQKMNWVSRLYFVIDSKSFCCWANWNLNVGVR